MADFILPVRRAMLPRMKNDTALLDLIPAASMFPATVPASRTFPFTRLGTVLASPFRASCLSASALRASVQAFTKGRTTNGALVLSAEDSAYQIGSAIKDALDDTVLLLNDGYKARVQWIQSSPRRDGDEAGAWMTTVTFGVEVAG